MNFSKFLVGPFSLKIYGLAVALAFLTGVILFYKRIQEEKFSQEFFVHHFWRWIVAGLVVGRLFSLFLFREPHVAYGVFSFFAFWEGEVHWAGVVLGFFSFALWDLRSHGEKALEWFDLGAFPLLIGFLITDMAAFLTGHYYGIETSLPWGIQYETFGVDILTPVHPVSLYAFLAHCWLYRFLQGKKNAWQQIPGKLIMRLGIGLLSIDFVLQFLRADHTLLVFETIRIDQIFAFLFLSSLCLISSRLRLF